MRAALLLAALLAACKPDIPDAVPATPLDPDGTTGAESRVCDVFAQDCEAGEKCLSTRPYAQPILVEDGVPAWCTMIADAPLGPGDACIVDRDAYRVEGVAFDDCAAGLLCWGLDDDGRGRCESLCVAGYAAPTCAPDSTCPIDAGAHARVCVPRCIPRTDDCEREEEGCYLQSSQWGCYPSDAFVDDREGSTGYPCSYAFHCRDDHVCLDKDEFAGCPVDGGYGGCCAKLCALGDAGADASCAADAPDRVCRPWLEAEDAGGYADLGVCIP